MTPPPDRGRAPRALLLDLDDTLLGNSMETFVPAYLESLGRWAADQLAPQKLISELMRATKVMAANDGSGPTNEEVFAAEFYPALGRPREVLQPLFERFYAEAFPKLRSRTKARPEAPELVRWAQNEGLQVVVATNPLFPATAIEQRLEWGGVPVTEFDYALVTTYEVMHATKDSPEYYQEILARIGRQPAECLMVGDDWTWDVVMPSRVGIAAYWIADAHAEPPDGEADPVGQGPLASFLTWIKSRTSRQL